MVKYESGIKDKLKRHSEVSNSKKKHWFDMS